MRKKSQAEILVLGEFSTRFKLASQGAGIAHKYIDAHEIML